MDKNENLPIVYAVSDGRGITAEQMVRAALVQFPSAEHQLKVRPGVTTPEAARAVVDEAADRSSLLFYTVVLPEVRDALVDQGKQRLVPLVDLLGKACSALNDLFNAAPKASAGLLYESDKRHFDMIEAVDYTLTHDDGRRPHELDQAHVVLVGVSRSSKSSTGFYLAYQGIRTANVPLVPGVDPPKELLALDPAKVVALKINRLRLERIRQVRMAHMGVTLDNYVDKRAVAQELRTVNALIKKQGWRSVDVSYKATEEVTWEIIDLCGLKGRRPRSASLAEATKKAWKGA